MIIENNYNVDNTITKFEGHPRIVAIKKQMKESNKAFPFQNISTDKFTSIIKKLNKKRLQNWMTYLLNTKKASELDDIPTKVIK